jgi:uncharacterized RDD family membrane protein YckC
MSQGQDWNVPGTAQAYPQPPAGQAYPQAAMVPAGAYGMPGLATAPVPPGFYFDQLSGQVIPEGTQVATVGRRIGSWFLSILLFVVTLGIGYIIWGAMSWADGRTPTQQVLKMQTWKQQTRAKATWTEMFVREISRIVYAIPFIGWIVALVSFFMFLGNKEHRAIHDQIGGTIVLHDPNQVLHPAKTAA